VVKKVNTKMATARPGVSIPHARLDGGWNVLETTDDGRTAVAVREDERSGVAMTYPSVERGDSGVERVASVVNLVGEYVLVAASVRSVCSMEGLVAATDGDVHPLDRSEYEALSRRTINRLLAGETLLVIEPETPGQHLGAIQMFDDVGRARSAWGQRFPTLAERFFAVERVLGDVGLRELAHRASAAVDR
jgi:hypothetical protein